MTGNVAEWVADVWNKTYDGAPTDGSARTSGTSKEHPLRGGGYANSKKYRLGELRLSSRKGYGSTDTDIGFRCARTEFPRQ
jgi:formylglycine-generating enzyme required for sulfatase activity